jgi:2-methylisocitrate lyase-like PEP mutase family enzyme
LEEEKPMHEQAERRKAFAARIRTGPLVVAPGIYDMISTVIADGMGFPALYMTGFGTVASHLGLPDAGIATYTDMVERLTRMASAAQTPIIADADTGYGGLVNVHHTVRGYERAGAAGIQIEDQEFPKRCGHLAGKRVCAADEMVRRIKVAVDARHDDNTLIIARTDARAVLGFDEALRRTDAYARAGADVLFIEAPESEAEMERIGRAFDLPLIANKAAGGRTPRVSQARLAQIGYRVAIYPGHGFLAAAHAAERSYRSVKAGDGTAASSVPLYDLAAFADILGFQEVENIEKRHSADIQRTSKSQD